MVRSRPTPAVPDRSSERGAAMFICLMVILMLSAIGTFALSNARYELQTSGFSRQRNVAQEMSAFAAFAGMNEFGSNPRGIQLRMIDAATKGEKCSSLASMTMVSPAPPCLHLYPADIEKRLGFAASDHIFTVPDTATKTPGAMGMTPVSVGFAVEFTDLMNVDRPIAGTPINEVPGKPEILDVTLATYGTVFQDDNLNQSVDWSLGEGRGAVFTFGRGHVVVGPIFK